MAKKNFQYIKGKIESGMPADIVFYSDVSTWNVEDFIHEFNYLVNWCSPSEIRVHINSVGGNCVDGISVFSVIQNCTIPVTTINDGLAASMASIIWAAGNKCMMKDYALLMIHNPFIEGEKPNEVTDAFKKQLSIIYQKRFGFTEEKVAEIMDGKPGADGTWYTASEAVEAGFLKEEDVIETPKAVKDKVNACIAALGKPTVKGVGAVMNLLDDVSMPETLNNVEATTQTQNNNTINTMANEISVVAAQLGLTGERATEANVSSRINELLGVERELTQAKADLNAKVTALAEAETKINGLNASVENLTKNYNEAKKKLDEFEAAEAAKKKAEIEALVDSAIKACKITKESRESWITQAQSCFELVKATLASIPARDDISHEIAQDQANHDNAEDGSKTEQQKAMDKVKAVVGERFEFLKPSF